MGKLTFRRVVSTRRRTLINATLPIVGGTLFLLGSFCFIPGASRQLINLGALCFLVGSLCYWAAPFIDFWELTHNYANLLEPPPEIAITMVSEDSNRLAGLYEHLYKSHLLRIQCANCLVYMFGGGFFVGGSVLFFPAMEEIIYHGGWLYITGCVLTLAGALLAMLTAFEMRRTALPLRWASPPPCHVLPSFTDENATILSCSLYVVGNAVFIIGSVCFFPKIATTLLIETLAVMLFVFGSILFTTGAVIDLIVIWRAPRLLRPASAPQLRGLSLGSSKGLGRSKVGVASHGRSASGNKHYRPMSEDGDGGGVELTGGAAARAKRVDKAVLALRKRVGEAVQGDGAEAIAEQLAPTPRPSNEEHDFGGGGASPMSIAAV